MMRRRAVLLAFFAALLLPLGAIPARADINLFGDYYSNIPRAVAQGDAATVQRLLADGISPQQLDENNRTGLHLAAMTGNLQIFALLMKAGAKLDVRDPVGNTPLHYAADRGNTEMVKLMLALRAPIDAENKAGATPLMLAASRGNIEVAQLLLSGGASPTKTDFTGHDALSYARDSHKASLVQVIERAAATGKR
jgi:uncharacterized protein